MKSSKSNLAVIAFLFVACWMFLSSAQAKKPPKPSGPSYDVIQLDDEWGGLTFVRGEARDINEARDIVGQIEDSVTGDLWAAYWSAANVLTPLNGNAISATGINDLKEIVGWGYTLGGNSTGLYWSSPNASPVPLSPLTGDDTTGAFRINNAGIIAGYSRRLIYGPDPRVAENPPTILLKIESHAVVWRVTDGGIAGPFELPNLMDMGLTNDPDEAYSSASNINDNAGGNATVVGGFMSSHEITAEDPNATSFNWTAAVAWTVSFAPDGSLLATPAILDIDRVVASGVSDNNADTVCGVREVREGNATADAVIWDAGGSLTLQRLSKVNHTAATSVNLNGVIVGFGYYQDRKTQGNRAVVWPSATANMILLDNFLGRRSPLGHLSSADAINNAGDIVGKATGGAYLAIPK